ncbi:MAG: P-II family nitrogen regulator [Thermoanaerobaculales bacterium]
MKLIKVFFRVSKVDEVVGALRAACAPGITISRVNGVGYGYEPLLFTLSPSEIKRAPEVARVEVVCEDDDVQRLVDEIVRTAHTGSQGDGIVFVTDVERAVKIRTGEENSSALEC